MGVPQRRVSQASPGADGIFERDLSLPFRFEKVFPRFEISSRNQLRVIDERRLDVGAENQIVTLRFIGKRQLAAAPLTRVLGIRAGKPRFDCDQRFGRQQSFERRRRTGNQQVSAVAAGGKLVEQFGTDLITGHTLQFDPDVGIFFLKGQSERIARLASLRSND